MLLNKDYESIVTDGLVLNFDAGFLPSYPGTGSSWYDLGPSQSNGTLQNGPTFDSGGWINFDGSNDYVSISSKSLVGSFTWMVVCFSNLMTGSQNRQTYFGGNTALFEQSDNDTLLISNFSDPAINLELPTSIIPQSIFYHICITRKSDNTFDFYHNGLKRTLRSGGSIPGDFVINQIGSLNGARFWNGRISNASVYNRVLSQSEILQNYYKGPIITDELVYAYDPGNLICFDGLSTVARSLSQSFTASVSNGTLFINENGGVWDLDGTDEFINLGTQITSYNFNPSTTNFSMGGWISIRQHKNYSTVIDITGSGAARNGLFVTNTGSLIYQVRPNAGTISTIASYTQNSIALNRWYHLFLTVDISSLTAKLYVNGSNVTTTTGWIANQIPTTLLEQYLGYYRDSGQSTNGRIGPVFLYVNKSLTDFEVLQNFNTQRSRFAI